MSPKAGWSTPLLHAPDIARSLAFYELLGFETIDTQGEGGHLNWARIHSPFRDDRIHVCKRCQASR